MRSPPQDTTAARVAPARIDVCFRFMTNLLFLSLLFLFSCSSLVGLVPLWPRRTVGVSLRTARLLQLRRGASGLLLRLRLLRQAERELRLRARDRAEARGALVVFTHQLLGLLEIFLRELQMQPRLRPLRCATRLRAADVGLRDRPLVVGRRKAGTATDGPRD